MLTKNTCNYCGNKFPNSQLYYLSHNWLDTTKVCTVCRDRQIKNGLIKSSQPLITMAEYLGEPIVQPISNSSTIKSTEGTVNINGTQHQVILQETVTTERKIIINPSNQS
jgi:hypothetical protein